MTINKGFIKDWLGNTMLPITRAELVLDEEGKIALQSTKFLAKFDDNNNDIPGLITAAERAMLNGGANGESITGLSNKVQMINEGLYVKETAINFYNTSGTPTPIILDSTGEGKISITTVSGNKINFTLEALGTTGTDVANIVKSIKVDKFGRVTEVTGSALLDSDIPQNLSNKVLTGCTATSVAENDNALVNKKYVDDKFTDITNMATGALKFGGTIGSLQSATNTLSNANNVNRYYKATAEFELAAAQVYGGLKASVKIGDTLIVYAESGTTRTFVHIPSGDDITAITVKSGDTTVIASQVGPITFKYDSIFSVADTGGNVISITMPKASATQDGYLNAEDWIKFNSYASTLSTTYVGEFSSGVGVYKIGTLTIKGVEEVIYGKNYESSLSLINGATNASNPILLFKETGKDDVKITLKGSKGIAVLKNSDTVEFTAAVESVAQTVPSTQRPVNYITVADGYKVGVKIGGLDDNDNIVDGLVDFNQFNNLAIYVTNRFNRMFEVIGYSLKGTADENEYRYGNTKLKEAVKIII